MVMGVQMVINFIRYILSWLKWKFINRKVDSKSYRAVITSQLWFEKNPRECESLRDYYLNEEV